MMTAIKNPMYCDPETGVCEVPGTTSGETMVNLQADKKPVRLLYFTDPICSSCWGIEPQLRKLKLEYGEYFDMEYRMGGLLGGWENYSGNDVNGPKSVAEHWEEASNFYQMPIDGDVWLEDPLDSSYPPSIAFKAAQMQHAEKAVSFMRKVREMLFLEKKNISKWECLKEAAEASNLNVRQFKTDYEGKAKERFEEDLELKKQMGVRGFPTIYFADEEGNRLLVYGSKPYEKYRETLLQLYPEAKKQKIGTSLENLFNVYPTYTTREFAEINGKNMEQAENALKTLVSEGKIKKQESKNGPLWVKA